MEESTYFLKEKMSFKDGNSVDTDVELKIISPTFEDGWIKVESVDEHNSKRIFWTKNDNLNENVSLNKEKDVSEH